MKTNIDNHSSELSEQQLLMLLRHGDMEAFERIYARYHKLLYALAYRFLQSGDMAEDTVQTVFVRLWEYRRELAVEVSLRNFLFTMTKNHVLNVIRNNNNAVRKNYELAQGRNDWSCDFLEQMERGERHDLIHKAIGRLASNKRDICLMKLKGMSNMDIAERMNLSVNTVKSHYTEALKLIR